MVTGCLLLLLFTKQELFYFVNSHNTPATDKLLYYATYMGQGEVIVPVLLLLMVIPKYRNLEYFSMAVIVSIIPFFIQQGLKSYFDHPRPLNYFNHAAWIHFSPEWPELMYKSFPSGHSEGAFSFFCFLSLLLQPRYARFGYVFFVLALFVCYSRMYLAAHFFADTYIGSIIGAVTTTIIFSLVTKYKHRFFRKQDTF